MNDVENAPIGVFDSGFGGLSVLSSLVTILPHERFIFVADTAHFPFGNRTSEQIITLTTELVEWFIS